MECRILNIADLHEIKGSKIVIYGAGRYGSFAYAFLELKGFAENVVCFAVTDSADNPDALYGKPVERIDRIAGCLKDCLVILALGERAVKEVTGSLHNNEVKDMCRINGQVFEDIRNELIAGYKKLPLQKNKILLSSYDGRGYCCNSKYIADRLLRSHAPIELAWLVSDDLIGGFPDGITKVVIDRNSPQFYKEVLTAKVYVTNTSHLLYEHKRQDQFYVNTWHGYGPFKLAGGEAVSDAASKEWYRKSSAASDLFITASRFYTQVYRESFFYEGEVLECGAPRNDVFFADNGIKASVYEKLGIPSDKKLLLYAPTFREDAANSFQKYDIDMERVLSALGRRFGGEYILAYRFHHFLYALGMPQDFYAGAIDATYYPDIQELLVAADVVITDYSSLMWDFSLQRRPVFLYQNDRMDYESDRGFYAPVSEWPYPKAHTQGELSDAIINFDNDRYIKDLNKFLEKYGSCDDGHAAERVAARIMKEIGEAI